MPGMQDAHVSPENPQVPRGWGECSDKWREDYYDFLPKEANAAMILATQTSGPFKGKLYYFPDFLFP